MGARSLLAFASRLASKGVSQGGVIWGGWSSLAVLQRCSLAASMHLVIDAQASCVAALETRKMRMLLLVAFLGPALLWSACIGADQGGRRALKLVAAIGRGSSNLVNAAGS